MSDQKLIMVSIFIRGMNDKAQSLQHMVNTVKTRMGKCRTATALSVYTASCILDFAAFTVTLTGGK